MTIQVNDQPRQVPDDVTVRVLLADLGLAERRGIAIAVNDSVVPRTTWEARKLSAGDSVLVIQATQGG